MLLFSDPKLHTNGTLPLVLLGEASTVIGE
jgi:hypothetical protein